MQIEMVAFNHPHEKQIILTDTHTKLIEILLLFNDNLDEELSLKDFLCPLFGEFVFLAESPHPICKLVIIVVSFKLY